MHWFGPRGARGHRNGFGNGRLRRWRARTDGTRWCRGEAWVTPRHPRPWRRRPGGTDRGSNGHGVGGCVRLCVGEDDEDVVARMVVGQHCPFSGRPRAQITSGGAQVMGCRECRIEHVLRIANPVGVAVVLPRHPAGGDELHRPDGAVPLGVAVVPACVGVGDRGVPADPSRMGPRMAGCTTPLVSARDPAWRPWSDSTRPMPAITLQGT